MAKLEDLTGQKFGRWIVLKKVESTKYGMSRYLCECKCGTQKIVRGNTLKSGESKSCGCLGRELSSNRNTTHGKTYARIYHTWTNMKQRCVNINDKSYKYYGDRGISVCDDWFNSFEKFYDWAINNGYTDELTIDRIDVNGDYCPENCRWVTIKTQANNRSSNHYITYNGKTQSISDWCEELNLDYDLTYNRLARTNWSVEKIFTEPKYRKMANITLYNQDCMKIKLPKCRLLLTDIPYGVINRETNGLRNLDKQNADNETFILSDFLDHIYDCFDICIIFCSREQISYISDFFEYKKGTTRQIVWCKANPSPMNGEYVYLSSIENAIWFKKQRTGKLNCRCKKSFFQYPCGKSKLHPTQKPLGLFEELILDNTNENDLVIDTCMGSGTTGVACQNTNRNFVGIELNKDYFNTAKERLNKND